MTEKSQGSRQFERVGKIADRITRSLGLILLGYLLATQGQAKADGSQHVTVDNQRSHDIYVSPEGFVAYLCRRYNQFGSYPDRLCVFANGKLKASPDDFPIDPKVDPEWGPDGQLTYSCRDNTGGSGEGIPEGKCVTDEYFTHVLFLSYWIHDQGSGNNKFLYPVMSQQIPDATATPVNPTSEPTQSKGQQ